MKVDNEIKRVICVDLFTSSMQILLHVPDFLIYR